MGVPWSHPINIAQLFIPYASNPTNITFDYTVPGLAKLLHFRNFIKAQPDKEMENIKKEANGYPYKMKAKFQVKEQISIDLKIFIFFLQTGALPQVNGLGN